MHIEYEDLLLRDAAADDAALLARWWNNGSLMSHTGFPLGLRTNTDKVRVQLSRESDENRHLIAEREGMAIGELSYKTVAEGVANLEIRVCIPKERGKGRGEKLLSMLITELFDMGYKMITARPDSKNSRMRHVCERLGFTLTEVAEDSWHDQLGRLQSAAEYELSPENFRSFINRQ